jgi:malate synthase
VLQKIKTPAEEKRVAAGRYDLASQLFDQLVTDDHFPEFLTLKAYEYLD